MAVLMEARRVAFLVPNDGVEEQELTAPWDAVAANGARLTLVAPETGVVQTRRQLEPGEQFDATVAVVDAFADEFDALVVPGGVVGADHLRADPNVGRLVREFVEHGKTVALLCHAPWVLIEAGEAFGRRLTSWPSLRTDIVNAGGEWVDQPVVVCYNGPNILISSRGPADLPELCQTLVDVLGGETPGQGTTPGAWTAAPAEWTGARP